MGGPCRRPDPRLAARRTRCSARGSSARPARIGDRGLGGCAVSVHRSERGQAVLVVLAMALLISVGGAFLFAYGQALASRGRPQRVADLAAISAARVMRTSYPRLFE